MIENYFPLQRICIGSLMMKVASWGVTVTFKGDIPYSSVNVIDVHSGETLLLASPILLVTSALIYS